MNRLSRDKQIQVISALVEGNSLRSTARMTGVARMTIEKLLVDVGNACSEYQGKAFHDLACKRIQCDEIWSFVGMKAKNVPEKKQGKLGYGDVWTHTAICADSKLILSWFIGKRDLPTAKAFISDVASRLANRVQLTTDGHRPYLEAVEGAFGADVDFSQLVKIYGTNNPAEVRYSGAECCGTLTKTVTGNPDTKHISTSYVERQNLTMRMCMRRFTRLTNGFSKKINNLAHNVALYFMYYNFCRIHQTLRCTPAMRAKVTDRVWSIGDVLDLVTGN